MSILADTIKFVAEANGSRISDSNIAYVSNLINNRINSNPEVNALLNENHLKSFIQGIAFFRVCLFFFVAC